MPVLLQSAAPIYPASALAAGKTAAVPIKITIDAVGVVTHAVVTQAVGDGFDEAAVQAALQYVFEPAEIDGKPAVINVETTIHFTIEVAPSEGVAPPGATAADTATSAAASPDAPPEHAGPISAPISLSGTVFERGTRRKLAGVIVTLRERGLDATTNADGAFFFHGVAAGEYELLATDAGYARVAQRIAIGHNEGVQTAVWMRPLNANPYESMVEGEREALTVTKRSLHRSQLTTIPGTFGDPIRVVQSLPGLVRAPFGLGLLLVRGSNPDDTGVYIDGHEVPLLFHFLGGPSIINPDMVGGIDLYPGGFPARFGRKHGGVVAIDTRPTESDGTHGDVNINLLDTSVYARTKVTPQLTVAAAGRRSYIDTFLWAVLPEPAPGAQQLVVPIYYDWQARADYRFANTAKASVFAIGSADKLRVLSSDPDEQTSQDLSSAVRFFRVIGSYERPAGRDLRLTLSPAYGRDSVVFAGAQAEASGPFTSLDIVQQTFSYRTRLVGNLTKRLRLDTGIDLLSRVNQYRARLPLTDDLVTDRGVDVPPELVQRSASTFGLAYYADVALQVTKRLRLLPSLRLDGYMIAGRLLGSIDPRLVARFATSGAWTIKAYVGRFGQPPQPEALDSQLGNPGLKTEYAMHSGLGFEWRPHRLWLLDSEAYFIKRNNLVAFSRDIDQSSDGNFAREFWTNDGSAYAIGAETLIRREISKRVFGWTSYTFLIARARQTSSSTYRPPAFDQMHTLNTVASYKPGAGWELGLRFRLSTGRADTPIVDATYDADRGNYDAVRGPQRSVRRPTFTQLDLRAEKNWLFQRWSLAGFLDVQNVFNQENVESFTYDYRFRKRAPVTSFPILPTFGIRGRW